ncbi:MAG: hypothetical protein ACKN89_09375 [Cyanobium sp.]
MISTSSIKMFKSKAFVVAGVATLSAMAALPAQAITGFTGPYAPANWTFSTNTGGSVDTSGAPGSIALTNQNTFNLSNEYAHYSITIPQSGTVSYDWNRIISGLGTSFGYSLNGTYNESVSSTGIATSGSVSFAASAGDTFTLQAETDTTSLQTVTISNFSAPSAPTPPAGVPAPLPLFGASAAYGWSRRLRRRLSNPQAKAIPTIA